MRKLLLIPILCFIAYAAYALTVPFTILVGADFTFTPLHTYFMSPSGNDANSGTDTAHPWLTPNHAVVACGDVIIAQTGAYTASGIGVSTSPVNCPSTSGGIDGNGQIYFANVVCATAFGCTMSYSGVGGTAGIDIEANHWSWQGWQITTSGGNAFCYQAVGRSPADQWHHIAFINNICNNSGVGFVGGDDGQNHNIPGNGTDYLAFIGNLTWNANQRSDFPTASIVVVAPSNVDHTAGVHILFNGNFAINNSVPNSNGAPSDLEGFMLDTPDAHAYDGKTVFKNNVAYNSSWTGLQVFSQLINSAAIDIEITQNTMFNNLQCTPFASFDSSEMQVQLDGNYAAWTVNVYNNITKSLLTTVGCTGGGMVHAYQIGSTNAPPFHPTVNTGGTGLENFFFSANVPCNGSNISNCVSTYNGSTISGANNYVDPAFTNTTDLTTNHLTQPNCNSSTDIASCMGWNNATQTASSLSVISDLTPTASGTAGKGYQPPKPCAADSLYPSWLKGVVYLQVSGYVNGATVTEKAGLVNKPCSM